MTTTAMTSESERRLESVQKTKKNHGSRVQTNTYYNYYHHTKCPTPHPTPHPPFALNHTSPSPATPAARHGDAQQGAGPDPLDVLLVVHPLLRRQVRHIGPVLDQLPRGQHVVLSSRVMQRRPAGAVPLVHRPAVLHEQLHEADVTAVSGEVQRAAAAREPVRGAHLQVRVDAGLEGDLDELAGAP